jgi:2-haloalkanoic acid dehalogenase type II
MSHQPNNSTSLTHFKALSFDCYGTLIDWVTGQANALEPILRQLDASHPFAQDPHALATRFHDIFSAREVVDPTERYCTILSDAYAALAQELGVEATRADADAMGAGPGSWAPFADTVAGLRTLKKHYRLIILSNVDEENMGRTLARLEVPFDAVYTAEAIGSYKPAAENFAYLFARAKEDLGVDREKDELLHVACSLTYDHVPAKREGLRSVWIDRTGTYEDEETLLREGKVGFEWKFDTIGQFAAEVDRQFAEKK